MSDTATDTNWKACFEQLAPKLVLFARQFVPSLADAEDVVQNAFIRFWRKQPGADPAHYPLLYAAVRTAALDMLRKDERRTRRENSPEAGLDHVWFDPRLEQREDAAQVTAALERLPAPQREVLVLRVWADLTFAEIAAALGESINTVASRYRYGLEALRRVLKPNEYERV